MSYVEEQEESGLKVGDLVRVTRTAKDDERGWENSWINHVMTPLVGTIQQITEITDWGVQLEGSGGYEFPYFVLEKVEESARETLLKSAQKLAEELSTPKNFHKISIMEEAPMKYDVTDKKITLQNLIGEKDMCNGWRERLFTAFGKTYGFNEELVFSEAMNYAERRGKIDWLVKNGYIKEKKEKTYRIGQFFRYSSLDGGYQSIYQLVLMAGGDITLVNTANGGYYRCNLRPKDTDTWGITQKEFDRLGGDTNAGTFTPINVEIREV